MKMVRYKDKAKRKLYIKKEAPLSVTNKYGVRFCGLPALNEENEVPPPNKEIGVPSPSAKQRHFGVELSVELKGKEKVSTFALTMLI